MRRLLSAVIGLVVLAALWEGYKAVGNPDGTVLFGVRILPRADDLSMPHVWDMLSGSAARSSRAAGRSGRWC